MTITGFSPEKFRNSLKSGTFGKLFLTALSMGYLSVISARRLLYRSGLLKRLRLPVPVICFGNISAGGTGKTSTVVLAAQELARAGRRPAVLIRGYKRRSGSSKVVVLAKGRHFDTAEAGDEALMLYRLLEADDVPVLVSPDRRASGLEAVKAGAGVILMDDGFQHFALERDADIVLVNATAPFTADRMLPLGSLREPPSGIARARAVIISHCELASRAGIDALRSEILRLNPRAEILESMHTPDSFMDPAAASAEDLDALRGKPAAAISGIGDPASFEGALRGLNVDLKQIWRYPDHHAFTPEELAAAERTREGLPLVTTHKDFTRFPPGWQDILKGGVLILSVKITFAGDGSKIFSSILAGTGVGRA